MFEMPTLTVARLDAPSLAGEQSIDLSHLSRMTLGDRSLEREVLQLFERQAVMLVGRMAGAKRAHVAAMAHTLKGSARGIGAWQIAQQAETLELAADDPERAQALATLADSLGRIRTVIADMLRSH